MENNKNAVREEEEEKVSEEKPEFQKKLEEMREENARMERNIKELKELKAFDALSGKIETGFSQEIKKEETPTEYAKRIEKGLI